MPQPPIHPAFRKQYPDHAARAAWLGVGVSKNPRRRGAATDAFFIEGEYQVTGYQTRRLDDGTDAPFTAADADRLIGETLDKIEAGRARNAGMSVVERFERALKALLGLEIRHGMISTWADYGGDRASAADWRNGGDLDCRIWVGKDEVARADVRLLADAEAPLRASFAAHQAKAGG